MVLGITAIAWAQVPKEWKYVQSLRIEQPGWVKISLPVETLSAARPGLEDLRLLDESGKELAYLIERPLQAGPVVKPAENLDIRLTGHQTVVTFATDLQMEVDTLTMETPAKEFIKAVSVEGSPDNGGSWQMLAQDAVIFQRGETGRLQVSFPAGTWSKMRVTVDDSRERSIPITGVRVHASAKEPAPAEPLPISIIDREESPGQSRLTIKLPGKNLTLADLSIVTPEQLFTRKVLLQYRRYVDSEIREAGLAQGVLYRLAVNTGAPVACLGFAADVQVPAQELILIFQNNDNPPLQVTEVQGARRPVYLVFLATAPSVYQLLSGNPRCPAPRYDLVDLQEGLAPAPLAQAVISQPATNPAWTPPEVLPEVSESGTAIDLGKWKYRKPITIHNPGVQRLELDPEVLDFSHPSLHDLRVVKNGRQLPYLVERTSSLKVLMPEVEKADDPKRLSVSRLRLTLPHKRLPLHTLEGEVDTAFFQRQITLSEEVPDQRGNLQTLLRASALWARTIGAPKHRMILPLSFQMVTGRLILTIENGDNPPLDLRDIRLTYPVNRLLFKASPGEETFLYFGNPAAPLPHYDIDLIAGHFLAAEKNVAVLSPLDGQGAMSFQEKYRFSEKAVWLFWAALCGLVAALIVIIARLLPKR